MGELRSSLGESEGQSLGIRHVLSTRFVDTSQAVTRTLYPRVLHSGATPPFGPSYAYPKSTDQRAWFVVEAHDASIVWHEHGMSPTSPAPCAFVLASAAKAADAMTHISLPRWDHLTKAVKRARAAGDVELSNSRDAPYFCRGRDWHTRTGYPGRVRHRAGVRFPTLAALGSTSCQTCCMPEPSSTHMPINRLCQGWSSDRK